MLDNKITLEYSAIHHNQSQAVNWANAIAQNSQIESGLYLDGYFRDSVTHFDLHLRFRIAGENAEQKSGDLHDGFVSFACAVGRFDASHATGAEREEFQKAQAMNLICPKLKNAYESVFSLLEMSPAFEFPSSLSIEQMNEIFNNQAIEIVVP